MSRENSRLIMELDKARRDVNRETINPSLSTVEVGTILPVVKACAKARADYIECLMTIASNDDGESCSVEQVSQLRQYRLAYEELVAAANALETVVERGYVDVKGGD